MKMYDQRIVGKIVKKFGVSKRFITMSLTGDSKSETADTIKKYYNKADAALDKTLDELNVN